jgi:hypothetical protein
VLAAALCLGLFAFWMLLGLALVRPLEARMTEVRKLLLAPAVGLAANGLPLFALNIFGVPVSKSAIPVGVVLFLAAVFSLAKTSRTSRSVPESPGVPVWRRYAPFGLILLLALVLTGRPMFLFNFNWVSFCNDDMANYCLGAHRVLDFGYFHKPDPQQLIRGHDYVQQMWFLHVPGMHRPGSEMVLAFTCAWTRMTAPEIFMVVILAMHLAQLSALAALVYRRPEDRATALGALGLLSLSALASLGALYQLIAQVSGLAIALAAASLLLRPMSDTGNGEHDPFSTYVRPGILVGVVVAGLMVFYPEIFPFLALTWMIFTSIGVVRRGLPIRSMLLTLAVGTVATVAFLNVYTPISLTYLFQQASTGTRTDNPAQTLFPYYLMPSGLANLWGIQPLATLGIEPWQSGAIAIGAAILIFVAVVAIRRTWRGDAVATFALVMVMLGLFLFKNRAGFGLYKLAMYAQPFFLALIVATFFEYLCRSREKALSKPRVSSPIGRGIRAAIVLAPLVILAGFSFTTQWLYVRSSCGVGQTFNEILDASDSKVYNEFRHLVAENDKRQKPGAEPQEYLVDSYNLVLAKFQSLGNRGHDMAFPSNRFYYPGGYKIYPTPNGKKLLAETDAMLDMYSEQFRWENFRVHAPLVAPSGKQVDFEKGDGDENGDGDATNTFLYNNLAAEMADNGLKGGNVVVVATTGKQSPFNRRRVHADTPKTNFVSFQANDIQNHLVFVSSELGHPYFSGGRVKPNYAIYQLESEPLFFRGSTMAGVGRYVLFQVINPSIDRATKKPRVRMVLEMTASYKSDSDNYLPHEAKAIGMDGVKFPLLVGRGSARVVSEPFEPQYINGQPYVQIDMGMDGKRFPEPRTGLMKLFGTDVAIDRRSLVGFLRDISLVSEEEYDAFKAPSELSVFESTGNQLRDYRELEYSGIYEDGWVSEDSAYKLRQPNGPCQAVIRGEVPGLPGADPNFSVQASLIVDGKLVDQRVLKPGSFELRGDSPKLEGLAKSTSLSSDPTPTRHVALKFTRVQNLPPAQGHFDGRPVAARLFYVGFQRSADRGPVALDGKGGDYRTVHNPPSELPPSSDLH